MEYFDARTIYLIFHILGIILGAGGAYMSDAMFFRAIKDRILNKEELGFLRLGSKMIWGGIAVLLVSGTLLFMLNPATYIASSKFLLKMIVVLVIIANGIFFHVVHIPRLERYTDKRLPDEPEFMRKSGTLVASGAISMISWTAAFVLGVLRGIPYTLTQGLLIYGAVLLAGIIGALLFRKRMIG